MSSDIRQQIEIWRNQILIYISNTFKVQPKICQYQQTFNQGPYFIQGDEHLQVLLRLLHLFLSPTIFILILQMASVEESLAEQLQNLTLTQILQRKDLSLDCVFSIKDILGKIKRQMKVFIEYCKMNEGFTQRMIELGFKTPIDEKSTPQLKNLVYVSADILTSDHEYIANLLIMTNDSQRYDSDEEDEIAEQIETEENTHQINSEDKYKHLNWVLSYIQGEILEENCINYIMKCLETIVRKKLNAFLQYLGQFPNILQKLVKISHQPSVANILAKLLTDDEDNMTQLAIQAKHRIIPLLLQKIHSQIQSPQILEVLQCVEEVLNSSRYGDSEERSILQKMSDAIVSENQITFHIQTIQNQAVKHNLTSFNAIFNSIAYLKLVMARMSMDEQPDYPSECKPYKPTLKYHEQSIFPSFCNLASLIEPIENFRKLTSTNFKLFYIKFIDLLVMMTKHSYFGQYYPLISKKVRINTIKSLVSSIANRRYSGILLQITSTILQKIILSEQKISQSNPESPNKVSPSQLYKIISQHYQTLNELTKTMMQETVNQRNRNQQGIYLRKLLVVLDNFFKNKEIQKGFPQIETVSKLFPVFNLYNCKQFTELTTVKKHPAYTKTTPQEFIFIEKNRNYLNQVSAEELQLSKVTTEKKLQQELLALQNSQKQQIPEKTLEQNDLESPKALRKPKNALVSSENSDKQIRIESPTRQAAPQPCLLFFIRHLAIY